MIKCMICENCIKLFKPSLRTAKSGSRKQRFCSSLCREKHWHKLNPTKSKAISARSKKKRVKQNREYNLNYYYSHKAKQLENQRNRYHLNPEIDVQRVINRRLKLKSLGSHTLTEWNKLKLKHNFECLHCKRREPEVRLTRDHIVPISKGGSNYISNIQPLCRPCNSRKFNHI